MARFSIESGGGFDYIRNRGSRAVIPRMLAQQLNLPVESNVTENIHQSIEMTDVEGLVSELSDLNQAITDKAPDNSARAIGVHKIKSGLKKWRQSLGRCGKTIAGTGLGGVDIVIIGDSIAEGCSSTSYLYDRWSSRLRNKLQDYYNPADVVGGYGYVPAIAGVADGNSTWLTAARNVWTLSGTWSRTDPTTGLGSRQASAAAAVSPRQAKFAFDGTLGDAVQRRSGVDRLELILAGNSTSGTIRWDVNGTDTFVTPGTGNRGFGTIATNSVSSVYGVHHGDLGLTLDSTALNVIQASTDSNLTNGGLFLDGCIAYNGDWDCGVRMHNLANWGAVVSQYSSNGGSLIANFDNFGAATTGASHAKLFIFNWITNDVGFNPTVTTTTTDFKDAYKLQVQRALACESQPSVLLVIPPSPADTDAHDNYPSHVSKIYEIADELDDVAILDLWDLCGNDVYSGRVTELGWNKADGIHYSDTFQEALASLLFDILTEA